MQLNRFTDYSLRVLIYLNGKPGDEKVSLDFLARRFNMNKNHLHKVSQRLAQLGWINSARGKNGGVSIADQARDLNLAHIVAELERHVHPIDCHGIACPVAGNCRLQGVLGRASRAFFRVLGEYSLAEMDIADLGALAPAPPPDSPEGTNTI